MVRPERLICRSDELAEGGRGVRFELESAAEALAAFAVRWGGRCYAYVNRCPHALTELDWTPAQFFDASGLYLICATHGATFAPDTGRCVYGPCRGRRLEAIPVVERDGHVFHVQGDS